MQDSDGKPAKIPASGGLAAIAATATAIVLGALAAGMIWSTMLVSLPYDTAMAILPLGLALAVFLRWQGFRGRPAIFGAAASTLLAFGYAQFLFGAIRIAQLMGFPLRQVLVKADVVLIVNAAWADLQARDWLFLATATLLSALVAGYRRSTRQSER